MDDEEFAPRQKSGAGPGFAPLDLDPLSEDDLAVYIAALEAEIARVKAHLDGKRAFRDQADAFFRK